MLGWAEGPARLTITDVTPSWFQDFVGLEESAERIQAYELQFVPGLLQTEEYMRAVIAGSQLDEQAEEGERRVALRMGRQTLLTRPDAPRLWAVIDEAALRRPVGSPEVMRGAAGAADRRHQAGQRRPADSAVRCRCPPRHGGRVQHPPVR